MKKLLFMGLVALMVVVSGCKSEAQIAVDNTSKDADNFEINPEPSINLNPLVKNM